MKSKISYMIQKYKNIPIPAKAAIWLTFCEFIKKGISVITVPVFTRILTAAQYGQVSVFISWQNIIILFTSLSLHTGVFNTAMMKYKNKHDAVVSAYLGLSMLLTMALFCFFKLYENDVSNLLTMKPVYINLLFLHLFVAPAYNLWLAQKRFEYHYVTAVLYSLAFGVLGPLIAYWAIIHSQDKLYARIASMTIVEAVFFGILAIIIFIKGKVFFKKEYWIDALRVNIPLIPYFLSGIILNQADRIMISSINGKSDAGLYSVVYSGAMIFQVITSCVNSAIIPWQYNKLNDNREIESRHTINTVLVLVAGMSVLFMEIAPELMKILAPQEYYEAVSMLPVLITSAFFIFLFTLFSNVELYFEKSIYAATASCIIAGLNVLLNYLLLPCYGYEAAAYTTLFCYFVCVVIHYFVMKYILKKEKRKNPYDMKCVVVLSMCVLFVMVVSNILYQYIAIIRYCLIILCLFIVFIKRNTIISLIKK